MCFCGRVPPEIAGKKQSFPSLLLHAADNRESVSRGGFGSGTCAASISDCDAQSPHSLALQGVSTLEQISLPAVQQNSLPLRITHFNNSLAGKHFQIDRCLVTTESC